MYNIFDSTDPLVAQSNKNSYRIIIKDEFFGGESVEKIRKYFKYIITKEISACVNVNIRIHSKRINDPSTIVVFETLVYKLLNHSDFNISIEFRKLEKENISYVFIKNSLIGSYLLEKSYGAVIKLDRNVFIDSFKKNVIINGSYYRAYFQSGKLNNTSSSKIKSDVKSYLNSLIKDKKVIRQISEVACELVGNVYDHANSECILQVLVSSAVDPINGKDLKSVNMSVINFSETMLISHIKDYFDEDKFTKKQVDISVRKAFQYHKLHFNEVYTQEHFYIISLFQKNFTTRINSFITGGTGLTRLIESLTDRAYDKYSYVMTGNKVIFFTEMLKVSDTGFVGFNADNNYFSSLPDPNVISKSDFFLNGTLFNICLLMEEMEN